MLSPLMLEYQKSRQQHTLTFLSVVLARLWGKTECTIGNYGGGLAGFGIQPTAH